MIMIKKCHIGPVRDHVVSATQQLRKREDARRQEMGKLLEEMRSEISTLSKVQPEAADRLMRMLQLLGNFRSTNVEEIVQRDLGEAEERLDYLFEIAADNVTVDIGERIERVLTEVIGNYFVLGVNGEAMVSAKLVQQAVKDGRLGDA